MNRNEIKSALDKIEAVPETKERVYWEVRRNAQNKDYVSKRKLHNAKMRMDRIVPFAAAFVILLFGLCYWGVTSGFLTGAHAAVPEDRTGGIAPRQEEAGALEGAEPEAAMEEAPAHGNTAPGTAASALNDTAAPILDEVTAYAAFDVGYTAYTITAVPQDISAYFGELQRIGALPKSLALQGYELGEGTLTLNFEPSLQELLNSSATTALVTAVAKSYYALYPDLTALNIQANGSPLTFQGEAIDATALMTQEVSVTDTKSLRFGETAE